MVEIPVADMPMIHDMSLTDTYAVVYDLSVGVDLNLVERTTIPFGWLPDKPSRVGLLPRDGGADDIVWCDAPRSAVFHPLNAYDHDGKVVVDLCRYEKLFERDVRGPLGDAAPELVRWTIDPVAKRVSEELVDGRAHEFPRHNPLVGTLKHRFGYTAGNGASGAEFGAYGDNYKIDFETGGVRVFDHGPGRTAGEPIFVPRVAGGDGAEDDGWLLVDVYDANTSTSDLVIIDAQEFERGPVAKVQIGRRVPFGFHGDWVPEQ